MSETDRRICRALFVADAGLRSAHLQLLRILEAQIQFFLQRVGVLVAADRNVAREKRRPASDDIDVHHARADIQQRDYLRGSGS